MALTNKPIQIVWFKKDLRIQDHQPLAAAARRGPVVCLYVFEDEILQAPDYDARHHRFLLDCLNDLSTALVEMGLHLTLRHGEIVEVLKQIQMETRFVALWSHHETGNWISRQRNERLRAWCKDQGIVWREYSQDGIRRIVTPRKGWSEHWTTQMSQPLIPRPAQIEGEKLKDWGQILSLEQVSIGDAKIVECQQGGLTAASELLSSFLAIRGLHYETRLNDPTTSLQHCSRLGPHLAFGSISLRAVYQAARERHDGVRREGAGARWRTALSAFMDRLIWHSHYGQKLEDQPELEWTNMIPAYDGLRETEWNQEHFDRLMAAQTGYPLIDASMRALKATGWLNFRMRALLVSFAAYDLWLDWRPVSMALAALLTDYIPGIHTIQMQMQSGVSDVKAAHIYNPTKQVGDHDLKGDFIRKWVPELGSVDRDYIADPQSMSLIQQSRSGCKIGVNYPLPIIEHSVATVKAKRRMFQIQNTQIAQEQASAVFATHGSQRIKRQQNNG